jgi:hypothetical protein
MITRLSFTILLYQLRESFNRDDLGSDMLMVTNSDQEIVKLAYQIISYTLSIRS